MVAFGRPYIANPDLVERCARGLPLNSINPQTIYGAGELGYTDYLASGDVSVAGAEP